MGLAVKPDLADVVRDEVPLRVAAIIPCYRVRRHVDAVIEGLRPFVDHVFAVDDACPDGTANHIAARWDPEYVTVVRHEVNQGVGGATLSGYRQAIDRGYDVLVKVDGDGQMDPSYVPALVAPISEGRADYAKGNRFFDLDALSRMPSLRLFGNAILSFVTKAATGYWDVMDPTNGFTAIHSSVARLLPTTKIDRRYFFETDMLFRLGSVRAAVIDVPMPPRYGDETSNLSIARVALEFPPKYLSRFFKRIVYNYFLRGFNAGSILLTTGIALTAFGFSYGIAHWLESLRTGQSAAAGVVMLAALPTLLGVQCLLNFLNLDVANVPARPIWQTLRFLPADDRTGQAANTAITPSMHDPT